LFRIVLSPVARSSLLFLSLAALALPLPAATAGIEELRVVGDASLAAPFEDVGNYALIDEETLETIALVHPNEAFVRVPGVWISRGSGQEHLTAIRSAVLSGPGACGAFQLLENGVPVRPNGFCNVNGLFELHTELAAGLEVVRGPASALYGGNALRGVINVLAPSTRAGTSITLEAGPWDYGRASLRTGSETESGRVGIAFTGVSANGWRDATGHDQQKLSLSWETGVGDWDVSSLVSAVNLNQETGGFVVGFEAYEDDALRDSNPNPEAYRDLKAVRASSEWTRVLDDGRRLVLTPYARVSDMDFLQHFLPGQPLEENGHWSGGGIGRLHGSNGALDWTLGGQIEYADSWLEETQDGPTIGSPFLVETRPPGTHYDYEVASVMGALFYDLRWQVDDRLAFVHSLRAETIEYDYDNRFLDGNTRDDGSSCGFGGCLYTRPADRDDRFSDLAGRLGLEYAPADDLRAWLTAGIGFRAPQMTELYRLQRGQLVADLDSESLRSLEAGFEHSGAPGSVSLVAFVQRGEDEILRDADGFNVSAGKTKGWGLEWSALARLGEDHEFDVVGTYARHEYDFSRTISGGSTISRGDDVDTAPRWIGSAHWRWRPVDALLVELEGVHVGAYELDPANTDDYRGHTIFNLRTDWQVTEDVRVAARVLNLSDERYADRADLAFGNYRYFPGLPRRLHVAVTWDL
jgi:outer membrane receptor protein involved in Fe transport